MVMVRSVFESQWPPKSPAWMTPVTSPRRRDLLHADVVGLGLENEPVHGVALGVGSLPMLLAAG
jgi:hypothetical protein